MELVTERDQREVQGISGADFGTSELICPINMIINGFHFLYPLNDRLALDRVTEKWTAKYPNSMKRWYDNWDAITPIFKFSLDVRKIIYMTNAIESLNSTYRKLNRQRSVFPSDTALLKALYLATFEATKKWTMSIRNWGQVYGELSIMYEGRLSE